MQKVDIEQLLDKYKKGICSPEEIAFIESWYMTYEQGDLHETLSLNDRSEDLVAVWDDLHIQLAKKRKVLWGRIAAAASIVLCLTVGLYYYVDTNSQHKYGAGQTQTLVKNDLAPGGNRALLTLADGRTIDLSDAQNGIVIEGDSIAYADGSNLFVIGSNSEKSLSNNQSKTLALTTPKGGQYQITLSDGTKVWLNAASTFKYPARFTGTERRVELEGEAYFEVAKNAKQSFIVKSKDQEVKVLGTHFNINAYKGESVTKTTLIEGLVQVSTHILPKDLYPPNNSIILKPGQQSTLNAGTITVKVIDPETCIAWKDGFFKFNQEPLEDILRKVSRWYDVEIEFANPELKNKAFSGSVSRFENVSQLLTKLELTGSVHFKIEGRRIIVMK